MGLENEIARLKTERRAVILAHNYCRGEVQDIADFTGDCPIHDRLELRHVAAGRRDAGMDAPVLVHPDTVGAAARLIFGIIT